MTARVLPRPHSDWLSPRPIRAVLANGRKVRAKSGLLNRLWNRARRIVSSLRSNRHQLATTTLTHVAKAITFFGSMLGLTILSVAVALVFIVSRAWFNLFVFAVMMTGESLLNVLLKHLFHRHRPVLENPLVTLTSYGFPSGHTMGVTVLFGLLALFLAKTVSTAGAAFAYFIAAGLVILLIGLTRVYLGAHFLSDVLGAFAASVVWLTSCWTAFETLRRRQKHRSE